MPSTEELIALIRDELVIEVDLDATTPLLSSGIVDSLGVVVLIEALEDRYGVGIDEDVVAVHTFDTPEQIAGHVRLARGRR